MKLDKTREEIVYAISAMYVELWGDDVTKEDADNIAEIACDGMVRTGVKFLRADTWVPSHRRR